MTITRVYQTGFELGAAEPPLVMSNSSITTSGPKTGSRCLTCYNAAMTYCTAYVPITATRQVRTAAYFLLNSGETAMSVRNGSTLLVQVQSSGTDMQLRVGATVQATWVGGVSGSYQHIGLDCKINSSTGWAVVYVDGVERLRYEGNTGNSDITRVYVGNPGSDGVRGVEVDDWTIDDSTGEAAAAPLNDRRYYLVSPSGNGNYADGVGSDGNSTDNYALVDEIPASDTDYVILDASGEKESYAMTNYTLPTNNVCQAVIVCIRGLKSDAGTATQVKPLLRLSSTDEAGSAVDLPTSYTWFTQRRTTLPGSAEMSQANLDSLEVGFEGAGTF